MRFDDKSPDVRWGFGYSSLMSEGSSAKANGTPQVPDTPPVTAFEVDASELSLEQILAAVRGLQAEQSTLIQQLREGEGEKIVPLVWKDDFQELGATRDEFYGRVGSQLEAIIGK